MADGLPTYSAAISSADYLSINPYIANIVQEEPTSHVFLTPLLNNTNNVGSNIVQDQSQFQSGGMGNVRSTSNIYRVPTMVDSELDNIETYKCWSLINIFCCCCCLGLVACYYSFETEDLIATRNFQGALEASRTARSINTVATILGIILFIPYIISYMVQLK